MSWLDTPSGRFEFAHPEKYRFTIEEIAHGLSHLCRFGGLGKWYSVAEHSVHVSRLLDGDDRIVGLLHDAHEPYTGGDIARPIKLSFGSDEFLRLLRMTQAEIERQLLGTSAMDIAGLKAADQTMLVIEAYTILGVSPVGWDVNPNSQNPHIDELQIHGHHPVDAERMFLDRWRELHGT